MTLDFVLLAAAVLLAAIGSGCAIAGFLLGIL